MVFHDDEEEVGIVKYISNGVMSVQAIMIAT